MGGFMEDQSFWVTLFNEISQETEQKVNFATTGGENQEELDEVVERITDEMSESLWIDLTERENSILADKQEQQSGFSKRLYKVWGEPLKLLNLLLILTEEIGIYYNERFRPQKASQNDIVFDVLIRLHARSSLISWEILTLLCNGYAFGAEARWRSLHETVVTAYFIADNNAEVAKKYILHEKVETFKAMKRYNTYAKKLNGIPFSENEVESAKKAKDELCKKYGNSFCYDYGWAASGLGKDKPTFSDIEEKVGLDYWRPYYKMASCSIHPSSKSLIFTLGLKNARNIMLAGPSNADLEEPGRKTAISLSQINSILLTREPDYLNLVVAKTILRLSEEIEKEFLNVAQSINEPPSY
jgi:hypothetical protein